MKRWLLYVLSAWLLLAEATAQAQKGGKCAASCSGISTKFRYVKGSTYTYKYESETKVQLIGNSQNTASVNLEATATFSVVDTCEWVLKLSDVKIKGPSAAQIGADWPKELEKSPLAFAYDNGAIRGICPGEEPVWALNIKRGVLSTFQLANDFDSDDAYETDIVGHCPVKQTLQDAGGSKTITQTKNLISCHNHVTNYTSIRFIPYDVRSNLQNIPLIDAKQICKYVVQRDIISEASCVETHGYLPGRNIEKSAGITATVTGKLKFTQEGKGAAAVNVGEFKPLLFDDNELLWAESKEGLAKAKSVLKTLCDTANDDVRPETPGHFIELVYALKTTSVADLRLLAQEAKGKGPCPKFRNFFVDAVAQCGTTACVTLLTELLTAKVHVTLPALTPHEEKLALLNIALTAHPTKAMVTAVTGALTDLPKNGLFAATALVNNYCRLHENCEETAEVKAFAQKYISNLSKFTLLKKITDGGKTIEALRAFGNLGYVKDGAKERLKFLEKDAHIDLRLAAIQSLRRAPCNAEMENKLFATFADDKENVEVRINAFLILTRQCATKELISKIVNATDDIHVNQIGSFVQSYFGEMRGSSDPSKPKAVYSNAILNKKFPSDPRKFSRYCEGSNFKYNWNVGYHTDGALIYTPENFFPKQAYFNFSVDIFGNEVNLFEVGLRTENFDMIFDELFGPEGFYTNPQAAFAKGGKKKGAGSKNTDPVLGQFQKSFEGLRPGKYDNIDASGYLRFFGDEMFYAAGYEIPIFDKMKKLIDPVSLMGAISKEKTASIATHRINIDSFFTIPVVSGFPLRLDMNSTMTVNLEATIKADVMNLPKFGNADVNLVLKPSAAVQSAVQLAVYTGRVKNGVRFTKNSHTSTAVALTVQLKNKDTLSAKLDIPKNKLELVNYETHVFTVVNDVPVEEKGIAATRGEGRACSPKKWAERVGLKLCSHVSFPNASTVADSPNFPLTGPFDMEIYVEKVDPQLTGYELSASWSSTPAGRDIKFSFNTPKSSVNRETALTIHYERGKSIDLDLKTPRRTVKANGKLESAGPDKTTVTVAATVDSKNYEIKGNLQTSGNLDTGKKYIFDGNVKGADKPSVGKLTATAEAQRGKKISIDLSLTELFDKPILWKAKAERPQPKKYVLEHDLKGPWGFKKISGSAEVQSVADMDYKFDIEYQKTPDMPAPHKLTYSHKHSLARKDKAGKLTANAKLISSKYPYLNFAYDAVAEKSPDKLEIKFSTLENDKPALAYNQLTNIKQKDYTTTATLKYPAAKVDEKLTVVYKNQLPKEFELSGKLEDLVLKKETLAKARLKKDKSEGFEGEYELLLKLPDNREYKAFKTVKPAGAGALQSTTTLQWAPDKKAEIKSTFKGTLNDFDLKSTLQFPNADPLDLAETFKKTDKQILYTGVLKKAGQVVLDLNLDTKKDGPGKRSLKARAKSDVQKFDVGVDGFVERLGAGGRLQGTVSRDGKEYLKGDIVVPKQYKFDEDKQIKADFVWGLPGPAKNVLFELKTVRDGKTGVEHDTSLKIDFPDAKYKFGIKRKHNGQSTTNATIWKNDKPIIELNVGRIRDEKGVALTGARYDVSLKTSPPMLARDLKGVVGFKNEANKYKVQILLTNEVDKQKLGLDGEFGVVGRGDGSNTAVKLVVNENEASFKNSHTVPGGVHTFNGEASYTYKGSPQKYKWQIAGSRTKVDATVETPFANAPKITLNAELTAAGPQKKHKFDLLWGNRKLTSQGTREYGDKYYNADVSFETSFEAIKNLQYTLKYDERKGQESSFRAELNKQHKIGAHYTRSTAGGDEKWGVGVLCKLGTAIDWESTAAAQWNPSTGKYVTNNLVRTNPTTQYKVDVDLNAKTLESKVNLENVPGIKGPVKAQAKKIAEDEYEIALGDGPNKGLIAFKLASQQQKFKVETTAFKANYESAWLPNKWSVSGDIVPDAKAGDKSYGVQFGIETPDQFTRQTTVGFGYPERKMNIITRRVKNLPQKFESSLEINPNVGKRQPTKFELKLEKPANAPVNGEFHLTDPNLPQGVHVLSKYSKTGKFEDANADFALSAEITFKYAADPKKQLIFKKESKRELQNQRTKITSSFEMNHEATNLKHKIWNQYLLDPCAENVPVCEYIFVIGTQFPDAQKQLQEYSIDFKRSQKDFNALINVSKDKYKISRKRLGKGQAALSVAKNDKEMFEVVAELIKQGERTAAFSIVKKPEDKVIFRAAATLASSELASVKIYHDENGNIVKDLEATIKLETSDRLRIKTYRRPGLAEAVNNLVKTYLPAKAPTAADVAAAMGARGGIGQDIVKELTPMFTAWDKEDDAIASELKITPGKLGGELQKRVEEITKALSAAKAQYYEFLQSSTDAITKNVQSWKDAGKEIISKIPDFNEKVVKPLKEARERAKARLKTIHDNIVGVANQIYTTTRLNELVAFIYKSLYQQPSGTITERLKQLYENLKQYFPDTKGAGGGGMLNELVAKIQAIREERAKQAKESWEQMRKELLKNEDYKEIVDFFDLITAKAQWAVNYLAPGQKAKGLIDQIKQTYGDTAAAPTSGFVYNKSADGLTTIIEIPLIHNFKSLPDVAEAFTPDSIRGTFKDAKHQIEDFLDTLYGSKVDDHGLFGSCDSTGLVVGDNHVVTFDGEVRAVAADCTYLLAKDFLDSKFSVSAQFERGARKNILVQYENTKIEFNYDGKVNIDGKVADLPWHQLDEYERFLVKVYRHSEEVVVLESFDGLKIECNTFNHICSVTLKGRFRGKTNGLLGRNDGEPYTDLQLPNGNLAKDFNEFLGGWALNPGCAKTPNRFDAALLPADHQLYPECVKLFGDSRRSTFGHCSDVDSKQFLDMCLQQLKKFTQTERDESKQIAGVCQSSEAFLQVCKQNADLPVQCINCDIPGGKLKLHEIQKVAGKNLLNNVDVIFAVEELDCLSSVKGKLPQLGQKIESSLKQQGLNVRFGLVGFNGLGVHYHWNLHTGQGSTNFEVNSLQSAVAKLEFTETKPKILQNPLTVIDFVIDHYSFRPASRKLLVLFTCSNCEGFELEYYNLQSKLLGQSFAFHLVTTQKIDMGAEVKDNFIGFDGSAMIKADLKENVDIRKDLIEPHDSCTVLAQETNGTVFTISDKNSLNSVFDNLATRVVKTGVGNECNFCECRVHDNHPKTICFPCEIPKPASLTADKSGFFSNPFLKMKKMQTKPL